MELRRREPAGARLGHVVFYQTERGAARQGRPALSRRMPSQAAAELHLVGEPQGPEGATCSRADFWASTTSACSTAARPCRPAAPGAGRRHGLDGAFCQNMLEIALELAEHDPTYEDMAVKFVEHFLYIASAMDRAGEHGEAVGRGGRLFLRLAAPARWLGAAAEGPFDGRPAAAMCGRHGRAFSRRALSAAGGAGGTLHGDPSRDQHADRTDRRPRSQQAPPVFTPH